MNSIEKRKSTRNFQQKPLQPDDIKRIAAYIDHADHLVGPYGNKIRLNLLVNSALNKKEQIGTYGFIKHAQGYILGSCLNQPETFFDFGYVFEGLMLYLTSIEIGNCWVGGTFKREEILPYLTLSGEEVIPAITPLGYALENKHIKERIVRQAIKADRRKPAHQLFFLEHFAQPVGQKADIYKQALHYIRIGPSAKNNQPWRIVISADYTKVHFYIVSNLANDKAFACPPEVLDIGIAYRHFVEGMEEVGIKGHLMQNKPEIQKPANVEYITTWIRN